MNLAKKLKWIVPLVIFVIIIIFLAIKLPFMAPGKEKKSELFIIARNSKETDIIQKISEQGFIRYPWAFDLALTIKGKHNKIEAGGYYLSKNMNIWQIVTKLTTTPDMKWVVIPEGLRKEQIGEKLAKTFNWSQDDLDKWNNVYTKMKFDYLEGVYFPDTYLIPTKENGLDIANRMINRFNEKFASYFSQFAKKDILWTTGLKLASIIQREAGGKNDMPLISGILWNRLLKEDMKLEVDATIQYAKGKTDGQWWSIVKPEDLKIDSAYNTYLYKGLPPYPICNPGLDAINAVLNPTETDCLFYLHDPNRQIHCAKTYEEHLENIKNYLQ